MPRTLVPVLVAFSLGSVGGYAVELGADKQGYSKQIVPFMEQYCLSCHDEDVQKGDVRFDTIDGDIVGGGDVALWKDILHRLETGEMPPEKEEQPAEAQREAVTSWIARELQKHLVAEVGVPGRVVLRRLSRDEYRNTVRDLLGIVEDPARGMQPDTTYEGFDHVAAVQELSPSQLRTYLDRARAAVDAAIPTGPRPITTQYRMEPEKPREGGQWRVLLHDEEANLAAWPEMKDQNKPQQLRLTLPNEHGEWETPRKGMNFRTNGEQKDSGVWLHPAKEVYRGSFGFVGFRVPYKPSDMGLVRLRVKAGARKEKGVGNPLLSVHVFRKLLGHFEIDADAKDPQWYEWVFAEKDLEKVHHMVKDDPRFHKRNENDVMLTNIHENPGVRAGHRGWQVKDPDAKMPHLFIDAIELDINYAESWPPPTQAGILFESPNENEPESYASEVLTRFMSRAFRRPVRAEELESKMVLFRREFAASGDFISAIKEPLVATLASPQFLFIVEDNRVDEDRRRRLEPIELASRLSYFLWSTMPDDALLKAALDGSLARSEVLAAQVARMLRDPRAERFQRGFMTQWLRLDKLDELMVEDDRWLKSYHLKGHFQEEPARFFGEMLRGNLDVMNFVHSEFAMVNERMAIHYGIDGVVGPQFRKVALKPEHKRGGLMTQAGVMALTTDGMITNPIYRGVWVLEKILDRPPPEAPANVPPLEDAPAKRLPLREQFAKHREDANCAACHKRIDPVGWPFERYGLLGDYDELGHGPNWSYYHDDKRKKQGLKPDMHGILPGGERVDDVDSLKRVFLEGHRDDVVRSVVKHLMIYALGRPLDLSDEPAIEVIMNKLEAGGDGARDLVQAIVASPPFLEK